MQKIDCKLILHSKAGHLNQIYTGFSELGKQGYIKLSTEKVFDTNKQILEVIINKNIKVIYDTMDEEDFYAVTNMDIRNVDYYFKRSFKKEIAEQYEFKSYPLGLNYNVYTKNGNVFGKKEIFLNYIKKIVKNKKSNFYFEDFECKPNITENPKICFLTRLWDPDAYEVENEKVRIDRIEINEFRANCIRACKKEFGENFIGGIEDSEFARNNYPDCIVEDKSITDRYNFMNIVKSSDICIATTGLHKSIGWKFGEYVAASRAIVTEKLHYEIPGDFKSGINYLEFSSEDELVHSIKKLIEDKCLRYEMMKNNHNYYLEYVRPDKLIMNTLTQVIQESEVSCES